MKTIKAFKSGDGAHCGLADWYPNKEAALRRALKSRRPFDTGWYCSKKEIASARISSKNGKQVLVEVSVLDDFDTNGTGDSCCSPNIEAIQSAIYRAWDRAEKDRKGNAPYAGYYLRVFKEDGVKCLDHYIAERDPCGFGSPPGDYYHHWGWQGDPDYDSEGAGQTCDPALGVPAEIVNKFETFANLIKPGSLRIGKWEIKAWEDDK